MKAAPFDYHRPDSVEHATRLLAELDEAKVLAGGQSLVPLLAMRLANPDHLVDVSRLAELRGVERRGDALWVGAGTPEAALEADPEVARAVPLLAAATPLIGHFQIRNRGTMGGSLAHADPAAEYPAVAVALDAELEALSPRGPRTIPAADFFTGVWTTALEPDELLVGARFPVWDGGRCGFAVREFARRHGDFAIAGAALGLQLDDGGRVRRCAIGLFGLGPVPRRATAAEQAVLGRPVGEVPPDEVGELAVAGLDDVAEDQQGSAGYRLRVGATMVARAWTAAGADALVDGSGGR
jgi:CO/xanthine dehydrogenase FAD-binding subunit